MVYRFAECELDPETHVLRHGGKDVHVEPQVFDLLALLASRSGELVTYDDLLAVVWGGRIVSDATLAARISAARKAVGDSGKKQAIIQTVQRRGVRLVVPVQDTGSAMWANAPNVASIVRVTRSADGTAIAWSSNGEGQALLRAGHWLTHLERDLVSPIWGPWIARLGTGRRLVRYDPRGTGMSQRDDVHLSLEAAVEDLAAVADAAQLDRFSIVAASQSAAVTFAYAARYPERVDRIVTLGGFVQGSRVRDSASGDAMTGALAVMIREGWGQPESGYLRALGSLFVPDAPEESLSHLLELQIASASSEQAEQIRDSCSRYDVVDTLKDVRAPVLVAHAMHDSVHPFSQAQLIAGHLANAAILPLEARNHILLPSDPSFETFMDAVDRFLGE